MLKSATALRRWSGTFSLAVAFGMLIWGQTVLKPYLQGNLFLVYWLLFLVFTCSAIGISLLDFFALRRSVKDDIATLKAKALLGIEHPADREKSAGLRRKMMFLKRLKPLKSSQNKPQNKPKTTRR